MGYTIERVADCANHLGESPVWDVEEGRLYWLDGTGRRVGAVHEHFAVEAKPQFGAGALYRIRGLGIRGVPEPRFAG
jgi:sugar lactone lactonase YvrE